MLSKTNSVISSSNGCRAGTGCASGGCVVRSVRFTHTEVARNSSTRDIVVRSWRAHGALSVTYTLSIRAYWALETRGDTSSRVLSRRTVIRQAAGLSRIEHLRSIACGTKACLVEV